MLKGMIQPADKLLTLREAAAYLGYSPSGLRKIVSKRAIRYSQVGQGPIRFRREWLDEFVAVHTVDPRQIERSPAHPRTRRMDGGQVRHGFDPKLFRKSG
jgi:excisionase family DNA binding protein